MIRIAIVGAGGIGKTHIDNLAEISFAKITDICDSDPRAAQTAQKLGASFYDNLEEMLAVSEAQVVLICTPTFLHYEQISAVLRGKRYCISEKPLCLSSDQARELFELADQNGVQLYVAHVLHFWEEYALLADLIKTNAYGAVIDAYFYRLTQLPAWTAGGWMFERKKSGLLPYDLHIHELDFIVSLFGSPKRFNVQSGGSKNASYKEYYRIAYEFENLSVCAEASWYNAPIPFTQGFRVYFEKGLVMFDGKTMTVYEQNQSPRILSRQDEQKSISTSINVTSTTAYLNELSHFLTCAEKNTPSNKVSCEQIIATLKVLEALEEN